MRDPRTKLLRLIFLSCKNQVVLTWKRRSPDANLTWISCVETMFQVMLTINSRREAFECVLKILNWPNRLRACTNCEIICYNDLLERKTLSHRPCINKVIAQSGIGRCCPASSIARRSKDCANKYRGKYGKTLVRRQIIYRNKNA